MKKTVLKLELQDGKGKQKAMKTVSTLPGIDSIAIDMKQKKMTVTGDIDPVTLVAKLRKLYQTEIVTFGPAKEPEKKKEEPKKTDDKKDPNDYWAEFMNPPQVYYQPPPFQAHHYDDSAQEDTNPCAIC